MLSTLALTALFTLQQGAPQRPARPHVVQQAARPNIVLIVADDFGVDLVGAYSEGAAPPCTPTIDSLASEGLLFRNAWANPVCSATRAALLSGRHGFRTGIGQPLLPNEPGLALTETIVPEMLLGYDSTLAGKWHLSGSLGNLHPNNSGFGYFAGTLGGGVPDYSQWQKTTNGQNGQTTTYATTDTADEAISAIVAMSEPWFLEVSFHAPHSPEHVPPANLCPSPPCASTACSNLGAMSPPWRKVKAMTEAMDTELGRVLAVLDTIDPDALVVFVGDNGTSMIATQPPFVSTHAKGTVYEGGVNVPLIVRGPGVAVGETAALVSVVDLYATFAELAHVPSSADDSISFAAVLEDPSVSVRDTVYTEVFSPNHAPLPLADHRRAVRDQRYKLLRQSGQPDEFYDLESDPFEATNLLPGLSQAEQAAHDALVNRLIALGVD